MNPLSLTCFAGWVKGNVAHCTVLLVRLHGHVAMACVKDAEDSWNHFPIYYVGKTRSLGVIVSLMHGGVVAVAVVGHYSDDLPSSKEVRVLAIRVDLSFRLGWLWGYRTIYQETQ